MATGLGGAQGRAQDTLQAWNNDALDTGGRDVKWGRGLLHSLSYRQAGFKVALIKGHNCMVSPFSIVVCECLSCRSYIVIVGGKQ